MVDELRRGLSPSFVLHTILIIAAVAGAFTALQSNLSYQASRIEEHQKVLDFNTKTLLQLQLDMTDVRDNLKYFREQYEHNGKH